MFNRLLLACLVLACIVGAASAAPKSFMLADNGKSAVTVVIPKNPDGEVERSARDLASYIKLASGAEIPVMEDGAVVKGPTIEVGGTASANAAKLPLDKLQYDGYIVAPVGDSIVIRGRVDEGTVYGVYGFLRDYLGIRWYGQGTLWEHVPKAEKLVLKVDPRIYNPDFRYRFWFGSLSSDRWLYKNRIRQSQRPDAPYASFGHNIYILFPLAKYGKDHPEFFPLVDGKRVVPKNDNDYYYGSQVCFTNPDVIKAAVETIRAAFDADPKLSQYSLSVNDDPICCMCPNCKALDEPYRMSGAGKQYSDSYFYFVSKVAEEIKKSHPDKTLGCLAYWPVELPPRKIKHLPDNVVVQFTQDVSQHHDPAYLKADHERHIAWSKIAKQVTTYNYYGLGWFAPRYYPHLAAEDLQFLHSLGVMGQCNEVYLYMSIMFPQAYMAAQLLWDADQDPDKLLDECFNDMYGPVAPEMKRFYSTLEDNWMKTKRPGRWFEGYLGLEGELAIYNADNMAKAMAALDAAYYKSSGIEKERVTIVRNQFLFPYAIVAGYCKSQSLAKLPLKNRLDFDISAREMLSTLRFAGNAELVHAKYVQTDPKMTVFYYDAKQGEFKAKMQGWEGLLNKAVKARLAVMKTWANHNMSKEEADAAMSDLTARLSGVEMQYPADFSKE